MTAPVIEATKLSKDLTSNFLRKKVRVLENLNLAVAAGETYGLLGPNGAGKTTTLKLMLGLMHPTSGSVTVLGMPAGCRDVLGRIGFLPENPYFYSHLTGREFLDFIGQLFNIPDGERKERIAGLLAMVQIGEAADYAMRKYSKGMLQRLGIAQSLINRPDVIFWDEPMSGLDPVGRRDVRQVLFSLKEEGRTIFFNSHLLPDVNEVCDRVGVLHKGRLVGEEQIKSISSGGSYRDLEDYFLTTIGAAGDNSAAGGAKESSQAHRSSSDGTASTASGQLRAQKTSSEAPP